MSHENPFNIPPEAHKAFAYGDDPNASFETSQDVLKEARKLSMIEEIESVPVVVGAEYHQPATDAGLRGRGTAVTGLNMNKIPEARKNVAEADDAFNRELDDLYGTTPSVEVAAGKREQPHSSNAIESARQTGIATAERKEREARGMKPRVRDLR